MSIHFPEDDWVVDAMYALTLLLWTFCLLILTMVAYCITGGSC